VYNIWWIVWLYAGWTDIVVVDNATNYVQISWLWAIEINQVWYNSNFGNLGIVTCVWWSITSIVNEKIDVWWGDFINTSAWLSVITSTTYNWLWFLTQVVADWVTYNLTYDSNSRLTQVTAGTDVYDVTYNAQWQLLTTTKS
jgi:hypothetical protein